MPLLTTTTGKIAYDERGSGHPVVLLPSGAHTRQDYDQLRARIPDGFRTLALDWPAHGESPRGEGPKGAVEFAHIAEEFVSRLAPEGVAVVGNSVGGFAAGRLAIRRPELVRSLVLVDSGGFAARAVKDRAFCALMGNRGFLRAIYPRFSAMYMRSQTDADRQARERAIETTRRPEGARVVSELWRSFRTSEHDLRADAHRITAPTLLMWGRRDPVIPLRIARMATETIRGSELAIFDTGHVPHTSAPEQVAERLLSHLARSFGPPTTIAPPQTYS